MVGLNFLGTLKNKGSETWDSATIEIELFDAEGGYVAEAENLILDEIKPGSEHHFTVTFHGYNEKIEYADYKIKVRADSFYLPSITKSEQDNR